jgi:hypothetical protein
MGRNSLAAVLLYMAKLPFPKKPTLMEQNVGGTNLHNISL